MDALEIAGLLRDLGGYGMAGVMWYFLRDERKATANERKERIRYRDLHETILNTLPDMTRAIEELTDQIKQWGKQKNGSN